MSKTHSTRSSGQHAGRSASNMPARPRHSATGFRSARRRRRRLLDAVRVVVVLVVVVVTSVPVAWILLTSLKSQGQWRLHSLNDTIGQDRYACAYRCRRWRSCLIWNWRGAGLNCRRLLPTAHHQHQHCRQYHPKFWFHIFPHYQLILKISTALRLTMRRAESTVATSNSRGVS